MKADASIAFLTANLKENAEITRYNTVNCCYKCGTFRREDIFFQK